MDRGVYRRAIRNSNYTLDTLNVQKQTMKKILLLILLTACSRQSTTHEVRYSLDKTDSVVFVRYFDGQQYNTFFMNYEQFKVLHSEGGYEGVYEYYLQHELPAHWRKKYETYKTLN